MNKHNLKNQKAITLIALIITIIVLLILAVVAIAAVRDSGIIGHAQDAANQYTISKEKEEIRLAMSEWNIQSVIPGNSETFKAVITNALQGKTNKIEGENSGPLTVIMKSGNKYTLTIDGKFEVLSENVGGDSFESESNEETKLPLTESEISNLEKYLFGDNNTGKSVMEELLYIAGVDEDGNITEDACLKYKPDSTLGIREDDIKHLGFFPNNGNEYIVYIEYKGYYFAYKAELEIEGSSIMITNTLPSYGLIQIEEINQNTRVGKYIKDEKNNMWRILYDDTEHGLQMISVDTFKYNDNLSFNLGAYDSYIGDWTKLDTGTEEFKTADLNENKSLDDNIEKAIYSYNQAIETLNKASENLFKDINGNYTKPYIQDVRCVGSNSIFRDKNDENKTLYKSTNLEKLPINNATYAVGIGNERGKSTNINYATDFERLAIAGINISSNEDYWLASRYVYEKNNLVSFGIGSVMGGFNISGIEYLWNVNETGLDYAQIRYTYAYSYKLRPVILLDPSVKFAGTGTETDPYIFK